MKKEKITIVIAIIAMFLNSCSKKESVNPNQEEQNYFKDIEIFDKSGDNSIIMRVSSDDPSLINYYSKDNFVIIPIKENQKPSEAVSEYYKLYPIQEETNKSDIAEEEDFIDVDEDDISVGMTIINKSLCKGVIDVAITVIDNDVSEERAGFKTVHHYSQLQEDKVYVERTSWSHAVYAGITMRVTPYGAWTTVLAYGKIANGDPFEFTNYESYKYDLRVRRRRSTHYTYAFTQ